MKPGSVLLVAHSQALLLELKEELRSSGTPQLTVRCVAVDLSTADGVNEAVKAARQEAIADLEHVLLFNNAGEPETKQSNKTVLFPKPLSPSPSLRPIGSDRWAAEGVSLQARPAVERGKHLIAVCSPGPA